MKKVDILNIINKYYHATPTAHNILLIHSKLVCKKALDIASRNPHLDLDLDLIEQGAMLHDIGIFKTDAPEIGCYGQAPYVCHGYLGGQLLRDEGLDNLAEFSENHTGVGLSKESIMTQQIPIPCHDYIPKTDEQIIVCIADKFFSKNPRSLHKEKSIDQIIRLIEKHNVIDGVKFRDWIKTYHIISS
ncbi:HD domain-containing protein [Halosquirtibacter xylanolyticus]|uniref:HD domain-containing protein n=1 Tax=Halosquirtibacter xylanolyticus TaxID=3374599 RepID=UPI003749C00E